jgi:hypothetical protein
MLRMRLKALSACSACAKDIKRLMRFLPKIHPTRGRYKFFLSVLKLPSQIGFDGVITLEPNISCLGLFKGTFVQELTKFETVLLLLKTLQAGWGNFAAFVEMFLDKFSAPKITLGPFRFFRKFAEIFASEGALVANLPPVLRIRVLIIFFFYTDPNSPPDFYLMRC